MKIKLSVLALMLFSALPVQATGTAPGVLPNEKPRQLEGVGITDKSGQQIDLNLQFVREDGTPIALREIYKNDRPVLLGLVYYECPNLCNFFMNGVTDVLKELKWTPGDQFDVVFVSIDPKETPALASAKKANHLKELGRDGAGKGWHFLTGTQENIQALAKQVGFGFKWDEESKQWAHTSAAIVTTPTGQVSRYLHGIMFEPGTLRLSLVEASKNKIGSFVDHVVLFCYRFDPNQNKYTLYAFNIMRGAALITLTALALFIIPFWRKHRLLSKQGDSIV